VSRVRSPRPTTNNHHPICIRYFFWNKTRARTHTHLGTSLYTSVRRKLYLLLLLYCIFNVELYRRAGPLGGGVVVVVVVVKPLISADEMDVWGVFTHRRRLLLDNNNMHFSSHTIMYYFIRGQQRSRYLRAASPPRHVIDDFSSSV